MAFPDNLFNQNTLLLVNMKNSACFGQVSRLGRSLLSLLSCFCQFIVFWLNPFWIELCYFVSLSILGFLVLRCLKPKTNSFTPADLDYFFMSVSSVTVSSMSTVEMEVFSNGQLILITILMLVGGEVFASMLNIQWAKSEFKIFKNNVEALRITSSSSSPQNIEDGLELSSVSAVKEDSDDIKFMSGENYQYLKYNSLRYLGYVVLGYLLVVLCGGSTFVMVYLSLVPSASAVLKKKGLQHLTFSVFTIVSTFTNCGFIPTNENMVVFKNNPGLLLVLILHVLLGNTLYPFFLRFVIGILAKSSRRREFQYMLNPANEIGYPHLLPGLQSVFLLFTVLGLILAQFIVFCCMEWNSGALDGMTSYQKLVGALFEVVNSRHTGESIVDLAILSPAVLVLFVVMMYLPPYTRFLPIKEDQKYDRCGGTEKKQEGHLLDHLLFSPLTYLVIFVIIICITERGKMKDDPLNFSVLNIAIEVISAYGNVGFSTGYSCKRRINLSGHCKDKLYGFSGNWSNKGKLTLIFVMFFGRLKNFCTRGGRAWKLL